MTRQEVTPVAGTAAGSHTFNQDEYERQLAEYRAEYFAAQEKKQQHLGRLILQEAAERANHPGTPRNIIEEVSAESRCGLVEVQLAFWTAHDRGQMKWNGDMFVPTDAGLRLLQS
jgi:hypothetical protein